MSNEESEMSPRTLRVLTAIAILVAAAPNGFFAPPLQLHMEGQMQAWLGIAVWSSAILAGVAFFFNVDFGTRLDKSLSTPIRTAALTVGLLGYAMIAATLHTARWTQMDAMRPWGELQTALPLFAALGAMQAIFWQGLVQDRVLPDLQPVARTAIVVALGVFVAAPFAIQGDTAAVLGGLLPLVCAEALLAAVAFELGAPVRIVMLLRALCGLAFVWFQQALLL